MKISGKHIVEEINGDRCSVVEKQASGERAKFLQALLEHNGYEVQVQKNIPLPPKPQKPGAEAPAPQPPAQETYKVGVKDIAFNVSVMVFSRTLKTPDNKILLPAFWNQESADYNDWYWKWKK